uniref:Uncharacterized protein n=1 Tax=Podoviridae sp. ctzeq1 TaxID=2826597 RepID=A0A8S5M046_9CAUD|nr:MAG TPA: hypothetical protein [Podoviridae sp. ctzeq1]DAS21843.1 MAG TPA: hypothetical protein [Caudoviricetes sp.]
MSILGSMTEALNKKQPRAPTISQTPPQDNSQTMAGNVANILNSNSLLMRSAAAKGERIAANRGLQNSTAGVEAAQRAMLDAAMPIASQDTQNAFTEKQTRLQADLTYQNQSKLNQQQNQFAAEQAGLDRGHQRGMAQLQSDLAYSNQSRLNQAQNQFAASQAELDRGHQRGLTQLQADLNYQNQSRLNQQQNQFTADQARLDRTHQRDLANINHTNNMQRLNAEVSANTIGKSIDFAQQITNNFDAQIAAVLNNTAMKEEDKKKAINMLKESRDSEMNFMSRFMQGIPTTRQNWSSFPNLGVPNVGVY